MFKRSLLSSLLIIAVIIGASILVLPATGETTNTNRPERRTSEDPSQWELHESSSTPPFVLFFPIVSSKGIIPQGIHPQLGLWKTIPFADCPRISFTVSNTGNGLHVEDIGFRNESCQNPIGHTVIESITEYLIYNSQWGYGWREYKFFFSMRGEFTSNILAVGRYTVTYCPYPGECFVFDDFPWTAEYIP